MCNKYTKSDFESGAFGDKHFGYDGPNGPNHWGDSYNGCVGKHQSPINIEEHIVTNVTLPLLKFIGLDHARDAYLTNNGHTAVLRLNDSGPAMITGGPLGSVQYVFEQLHFHWGENDLEGSEDLINNHSFAMELHVVFYKQNYGSMAHAIDHSDGLTVLAYFFEAGDDDNPTYEPIVNAVSNIQSVESNVTLAKPMNLESILIPNHVSIQDYFTYNGSLTTPPCSESVIWIDFKDNLRLSHKQIAAFRNIQSTEGVPLTHNFRPVQPLEDRQIFHNIPITDIDSKNSGQSTILALLSLTCAAVILTAPSEIWTGFFNLLI
ncbi:hypothetical protein PV326_007577 [Microctonus aethiopoides]|nr:hypothetical protein PV326_007577 [Microctonus aethiopoides]